MPDKSTIEKAEEDKAEGKSASTQAGEFVHDEIEKIRGGEHGASSAKQAIAIGLSEARRAGIDLPVPENASGEVKKKAEQDLKRAHQNKPVSQKRSRARIKALKKEPTSTVSKKALSKQAKSSAKKRSIKSRSVSAERAAKTRSATKSKSSAKSKSSVKSKPSSKGKGTLKKAENSKKEATRKRK